MIRNKKNYIFFVTLLLPSAGLGLSRGFGKTTKKRSAVPKKKDVSSLTSSLPQNELPRSDQIDRFGLPLDFGENEVDQRIAAQCIAGNSDLSLAQNNVIFSVNKCAKNWLPRLKMLHQDPLIIRVSGFLSVTECESLINLASKSRAKEMPKNVGTFDQGASQRRTSTTWYCRYQEPEAAPLLARAGALLDCDWTHFEELQLARYLPGEQFKWHEDAVPPSLLSKDVHKDGGQRIATLLVYLSGVGDPLHGGTTTFRDLGISISPVQGDAILFFPAVQKKNVDEQQVVWQPDPRTLHAAEPVLSSEYPKWVSQLWIHEAPYPPTIFKHDNPRHPDHAAIFSKYTAPPPLPPTNI